MAYFGGARTERSVPRVDARTALLVATAVALIILIGLVALNPDIMTSVKVITQKVEPVEETPRAQFSPATAAILVAANDIHPGEMLRPKMFRLEVRPVQGIEESVVTDVNIVNGQWARSFLPAKSALLKEQMSAERPVNSVTAKIPQGYRAVAIPINALTGVEGWVRPPARVDVVWATVRRGKEIVTTIVENAEVISASQTTEEQQQRDKPKSGYVPRFVTLLVTRKDAQKIQLAKQSGILTLNLRGDEDEEHAGSDTLTIDSLLRPIDAEYLDEVTGHVTVGDDAYIVQGGKLKIAETQQKAEVAENTESVIRQQ